MRKNLNELCQIKDKDIFIQWEYQIHSKLIETNLLYSAKAKFAQDE